MKAFLFKYIMIVPVQYEGYMLVHADTIEEAYKKLNEFLNKTQNSYDIKLATLF